MEAVGFDRSLSILDGHAYFGQGVVLGGPRGETFLSENTLMAEQKRVTSTSRARS